MPVHLVHAPSFRFRIAMLILLLCVYYLSYFMLYLLCLSVSMSGFVPTCQKPIVELGFIFNKHLVPHN